ncbi:MAG TPA: folate family ECF transporter S component [Candidatus Monoglobus merdigallinarum]|uniref:Folate family ECF transporter S component n=1 Tax=Candidatus Monoglobus merdigallinarum TaxID=2838698 RepID=A0A9D1PP49_9FIRM|nr:folate family ECF transporter S component [Candidatus Monoglobus merdigallinarum]
MQIFHNKLKSGNNFKAFGGIRLFGNLKVMLICALLISMSIVFKQIAITMGPFRISFENLPLLISGMIFGPVIGLVTGAVSDILGCFFSGYTINPIITVGAASIGLISGLVSFYAFKKNPGLRTVAAVAAAHIIGSMIIKSIGLHVYYQYPFSALALRVPLYIIIGSVEGFLSVMLLRNKAFSKHIAKVCGR